MSDDLLERIDAVTAAVCGWCQQPLAADGPSEDFCNEDHAWQWHNGKAQPRPGGFVNVAGEVYFGQPGDWTRLGTATISFDWRPPADVTEYRMELAYAGLQNPWDHSDVWQRLPERARWFLGTADGQEVEVPAPVVDAATPIRVHHYGLPAAEQARASVAQVVGQFAHAADRIREGRA